MATGERIPPSIEQRFKPEVFATTDEFLSECIHQLEVHGLSRERSQELKQAQKFIRDQIRYPQLHELYRDSGNPEAWERMLVFLAIGKEWQQANLKRKKELLYLLAEVYPPEGRNQEKFIFERQSTYKPEKRIGIPVSTDLMYIVYRYYEDLIHDEKFLKLLVTDPTKNEMLKNKSSFLELVWERIKKEDSETEKLIEDLFVVLQSYAEVAIKDKHGNDVHEYSLDFSRDERIILHKWLVDHGIEDHLGLRATAGINGISYIYFPYVQGKRTRREKREVTQEHERLHMQSSGFKFHPFGTGLNEGMTELLAEKKVFSQRWLGPRMDAWIHHLGQDSWAFDKKSTVLNRLIRKGWLFLRGPDGNFGMKGMMRGIYKIQTYEESVALLIRIFKRFPDLKKVFEDRYFDRSKSNVFRFAAEVMNTFGVEGYLSLLTIEPFRIEKSQSGLQEPIDFVEQFPSMQ